MNDDDIAELMRNAASTEVAPPAAFDHSDVLAGSRRITRRRRTLVGAAGVVLLAGIGGAVVIPNLPAYRDTVASAAPSSAADAAAPHVAREASPAVPGHDPVVGPPLAGRRPAAMPGPLGPGTATCANPQDPELRRALDAVFPEATSAPEAATADVCRPTGGRGVNLEIGEGPTGGLLTVAYAPPGQPPGPVARGGATATQPTASGGSVSVTVSAAGPGGATPYADRVADIARMLAPRL